MACQPSESGHIQGKTNHHVTPTPLTTYSDVAKIPDILSSLLKRIKTELQAEAENLHATLGMPAQERNRFADMDKSQLIEEVCVM